MSTRVVLKNICEVDEEDSNTSIKPGVKRYGDFHVENLLFEVKNPDSRFVGRAEELKKIHDSFKNFKIVAVVGEDGNGKTELMKKYASQYSNYFKHFIWINALNRDSVVESFTRLYNLMNKNEKYEELDNTTHFLNELFGKYIELETKTLLMFDNVHDFKTIENFIPKDGIRPHQIYTLMNSQNQNFENIKSVKTVELDVFSEIDGMEYIKKEIESEVNIDIKKKEIKKIFKKLQAFPLALSYGVGYITKENGIRRKFNEKLYTISDYLKEYEPKKLLQSSSKNETRYEVILRIWNVTINRISRIYESGKFGEEMFNIFAFLGPAIDVKLFLNSFIKIVSCYDRITETQARHSLSLLEDFSMLKIEKQTNMNNEEREIIYVHPIVQLVVRSKLYNNGEEEKVLERALDILKIMNEHSKYDIDQTAMFLWSFSSKYNNLVKKFYPSSIYGRDENSPLHLFTKDRNVSLKNIVKWKDFIDLNQQNLQHRTPLDEAVRSGHLEGVGCLLNNGAKNSTYNYEYIADDITFKIIDVSFLEKFQYQQLKYAKRSSSEIYHLSDKNGALQLTFFKDCGFILIDKSKTDENLYSLICSPKRRIENRKILVDKLQHSTLNVEKYKTIRFVCNFGNICLRLKLKPEIITLDKNHAMNLHLAVSCGHLEVVKLFMNLGSNPMGFNQEGQTALHIAAKHNRLKILKYFIEELEIDVNIKNNIGETPLHVAAFNNTQYIVEYLLQKGADLNAEDELGLTPVFDAVYTLHSTDILRYFLSLGVKLTCNPDSLLGKLGITLPHFAILCDKSEAIEVLKSVGKFGNELEDIYNSNTEGFPDFLNKIDHIFNNIDTLSSSDILTDSIQISISNLKKNLFTKKWEHIFRDEIQGREQIRKEIKSTVKSFEKSLDFKRTRFWKKIREFALKYEIKTDLFEKQHFNDNINWNNYFDAEYKIDDDSDNKSYSESESELHLDSNNEFKSKIEPKSDKADNTLEDELDTEDDSKTDLGKAIVSIKNYEPSEPTSSFAGRDNELSKLHEYLHGGRKTVIIGKAGIGKSELVRMYIKKNKDDFSHIIWINASTRSGVITLFKRLNDKITSKSNRYFVEVIDNVHRHYDCAEKTLYIFDNAERFEAIEDFLPKNGARVVITSLNRYWNNSGSRSHDLLNVIEVNEFTESEAEHFAKTEIPNVEDGEAIKKLCNALCYRPLALNRVVGYMKRKQNSYDEFTIHDFLKAFRKYMLTKDIYFLNETDCYDKISYIIWKMSIDNLKDDKKSSKDFKTLLYSILENEELILNNISSQMGEDLSMIIDQNNIGAFINMTKIYLCDEQPSEKLLRNILELYPSSDEVLRSNFDAFALNVWTRAVNHHRLVSEFHKNSDDKNLNIPLRLFIMNQKKEELEKLLSLIDTIKIDSKDMFLKQCLQLSAQYNFKEGIKMAIQFGANINARYTCGQTVLHISAANGYQDVVMYLIQNAKHLVNIRDVCGCTAASLAAYFGHIKIVDLLTLDDYVRRMGRLFAAIKEDDEHTFALIMDKFELEHPSSTFNSIFEKTLYSGIQIEDESSFMKFTLTDNVKECLSINSFNQN